MPPKRSRKPQPKSPVTPSGPKSNARKKQEAASSEEEILSPKATPRKSRGSKSKVEDVDTPDVKQLASTKKTATPKTASRRTRASQGVSPVKDQSSENVETPKKAAGTPRNSRQKRNISAVENDPGLPSSPVKVTPLKSSASKKFKKNDEIPKSEEATPGKKGRQTSKKVQMKKVDEESEDSVSVESEIDVPQTSSGQEEPSTPQKLSPVKKSQTPKQAAQKSVKNIENDAVDEPMEVNVDESKGKLEKDNNQDESERDIKEEEKTDKDSEEPQGSPIRRGEKADCADLENNASEDQLETVMEENCESKEVNVLGDPVNLKRDEVVENEKQKESGVEALGDSIEADDCKTTDEELHTQDDSELERNSKDIELPVKLTDVEDAEVKETSKEGNELDEEDEATEVLGDAHEEELGESDKDIDESKGGKSPLKQSSLGENDPTVDEAELQHKKCPDEERDADGDSSSIISLEKDSKGESSDGFEGFDESASAEKCSGMGKGKDKENSHGEIPSAENVEASEKEIDIDQTSIAQSVEGKNNATTEVSSSNTSCKSFSIVMHKMKDNEEEKVDQVVKTESVDDVSETTSKLKEPNSKGRSRRSSRRNAKSEEEKESIEPIEESMESVAEVSEKAEKSPVGRKTRSRKGAGLKDVGVESSDTSLKKTEEKPSGRMTRGQKKMPLGSEAEVESTKGQIDIEQVDDSDKQPGGLKRRRASGRIAASKTESKNTIEESSSDKVKDVKQEVDPEPKHGEVDADGKKDDSKQEEVNNKTIKQEEMEVDDIKQEEIDVDGKDIDIKQDGMAVKMKSEVEGSKHDLVIKQENLDEDQAESTRTEASKQIELKGQEIAKDTMTSDSEGSKKRKSRWDDPRNFEERCKEKPAASTTSVPVKIISSEKETKTAKLQQEIYTGGSSGDQQVKTQQQPAQVFQHSFQDVVILADAELQQPLRSIQYHKKHPVSMIFEQNLSVEKIVDVIQKNKGRYAEHSLWILVSGMHDICKGNHTNCGRCKFKLKQYTLDEYTPSVEEIAENVKMMINNLNQMYEEIQNTLGSDGMLIAAPPMPLQIAIEDAFPNHAAVHKTCSMNYLQCSAKRKTMQSLWVWYNMFCDAWTQNACELMKSFISTDLYQNFKNLMRGENIGKVEEVKACTFFSKQKWSDMMLSMMDKALTTPYPNLLSFANKEKLPMFEGSVIIGNVNYLDDLKQLTTNLPVTFVDEDIYFDEDGMSLLKAEQVEWPSKTMCFILSGVSRIAEPLSAHPKCEEASCEQPYPIFIPKNHAEAESDHSGKSCEEMVDEIVKEGFEFAKNAIEVLKDGTALFLAPILPLTANFDGDVADLSHDALHEYLETASGPIFSDEKETWIQCAKDLEMKWLDMTMKNLEADSVSYRLYEMYNREKPDVLQFYADKEKLSEDVIRKKWSNLMYKVLEDFLNVPAGEKAYQHTASNEEIIPDIQILTSDYDDIVKKAESDFTEEGYLAKNSSNFFFIDPSDDANSAANKSNYGNDYSGKTGNSWDWTAASQGTGAASQGTGAASYDYHLTNQSNDGNYGSYSNMNQHNYQYQGMDNSYQTGMYAGGPWMGGPPPPSWNAGPPPGFPPMWGHPPPQWMPGAPSLLGAAPPGPPPTSWGASGVSGTSGVSQWSTAPPPPPTWTSAPPPSTTPAMGTSQLWQNVPPAQPLVSVPEPPKSNSSSEENTTTGTNIMVQNVSTDMRVDQAKKILDAFGDLSYLKWPLDHLNKPAKFLMACFKDRENAEKCGRVLNYLKVFGRVSEVKVIGSAEPKDAPATFRPEDTREISIIQDLLNKVKDENSVKFKENSNRIVVSNISTLASRKVIDAVFLSLKANRSFQNLDLSVISSEEELHYFVCGDILNVKMMDGYRFPDRKLRVKLVGPDEAKMFAINEKESARRQIELLMKKHIDNIADMAASKYISKKEVNIYTFKTVRCQDEKNCKNAGLCHDYHIWKDRRRCPILFKYSDEMCPNLDSNGKCPSRDKCSKAHSPLEIPFHLKNFRAHICSSARKKGYCNKTDKICAYLHPGTTETFFDRQWRDVYVEGLEKTITYFVGAIMNLFKVSKQTCVRVLLITPAPELVTVLVKSMEALAFSCDQEIQALSEDGRAKKATILVGTPNAVVNWMAEEKRSKNVNLDRLKALIIDDGPGVVEIIDSLGHNFLIEFAKIKDLNKVVTAEKINRHDVQAFERLRILTDYKKIYAKDDKGKPSSSSRDRSSSPSKRSSEKQNRDLTSGGRDGSISRMESSRNSYSLEREKPTYDEAPSKTYKQESYYEEKLRQERERKQEEVLREQEMLLREQMQLQTQMRRDIDEEEELRQMMRNQEIKLEQERQERLEKDRLEQERLEQERLKQERLEQERLKQERLKQERQTQERQTQERLKQERLAQERLEQERLAKESQEREKRRKIDSKERNYKKYLTAKEDLKREHEREQKLYLELPEVHPEYEEKYRVFLNQYRSHYPGRDDSEHCKKLWMLFWKELVTSMLETAYKKKKELLDSEYRKTQEKERSEMESLKRKAASVSKDVSKYSRKDYSQPKPGTSSEALSALQGLKPPSNSQPMHAHTSQSYIPHASLTPSYSDAIPSNSARQQDFSIPPPLPKQIESVSSQHLSIPQAVNLLNEACDVLGEISPAVRMLLQKVSAVSMDSEQTRKLFTDSNNAMIMRIAAGKFKELSDQIPSPNKEKLALASYQATQLLEIPASTPAVVKKPYHGLDINKLARATYNKDPTFTIQFIKNALLYEGVTDATQGDISDIFVTLTTTQYNLGKNKP